MNNHLGNEFFRTRVNNYKIEYVACPKNEKGKYSAKIFDEIQSLNPPGRFLKMDKKSNLWCDIGQKKSLEKIRQALREGAPDIMKGMTEDVIDSPFLTSVHREKQGQIEVAAVPEPKKTPTDILGPNRAKSQPVSLDGDSDLTPVRIGEDGSSINPKDAELLTKLLGSTNSPPFASKVASSQIAFPVPLSQAVLYNSYSITNGGVPRHFPQRVLLRPDSINHDERLPSIDVNEVFSLAGESNNNSSEKCKSSTTSMSAMTMNTELSNVSEMVDSMNITANTMNINMNMSGLEASTESMTLSQAVDLAFGETFELSSSTNQK